MPDAGPIFSLEGRPHLGRAKHFPRVATTSNYFEGAKLTERADSAKAGARGSGPRRRGSMLGPILTASACVLLFALALSSQASAGEVRLFKESFGSAVQPTFGSPEGLAVDGATGDLLVIDAESGTLSRWSPDGTPADFSALGSNVITGTPTGEGGTEEPLIFAAPSEVQIAVDDSGGVTNGDIYVTQAGAHLVDIFAPTGNYIGQLTAAAGEAFGEVCGVSVDEAGDVYISEYTNGQIYDFAPTANPAKNEDSMGGLPYHEACSVSAGVATSAGSVFATRYSGAVTKLNSSTGAVEYVVSEGSNTTTTVDASSGNVLVATGSEVVEYNASGSVPVKLSTLQAESAVTGVAVSAAGEVYVARQGASEIDVFGAAVPVPRAEIAAASNVIGAKATLNGSINPDGLPVEECLFEWGRDEGGEPHYDHSTECSALPPNGTSSQPVSADISGLVPDGTVYHYRLVASNENGKEVSGAASFETAETIATEPPTAVTPATATLGGTIRPEGRQYEKCTFEYGLNSSAGFDHEADCEPSAAELPLDFLAQPVHLGLTGLRPNTTYKFRLTAKTAEGEFSGRTLTFSTTGAPLIAEVRARDADQGSATLEATIDPRGFYSTYLIEWGPTDSYGNVAASGSIGLGEGQTVVTGRVRGLSPGTLYHYRVRASSEGGGDTVSPDQEFETLNSCGLPDGRCLEMVSPPGARLVALPQETTGLELSSQAAETPGLMEFQVEGGYTGAEVGGENLYLANRGSAGWQSKQYTPSMIGTESGGNQRSRVLGFSRSLDCSVIASSSALTDDPAGRGIERVGGANLYRRGSDDDYELITYLPPETLQPPQGPTKTYELAGMSQDCRRVVFSTTLHYPGIPGAGESRLYEWNNGRLSNVGWVPDGSGEEVAEATAGSSTSTQGGFNTFNAVSVDASRVFFTATSQVGKDAGNSAVFVRIDGSETLDVSQSSLIADTGAEFQGATPDGSRVYFTANSGLADNSSPSGQDLYECQIVRNPGTDRAECRLTDLSVGDTGEPAEVGATKPNSFRGALAGVSDNGSRVYFVARGQLVAGEGASGPENRAEDTMSMYLHEATTDKTRFVGAIGENDVRGVATTELGFYTSRVSADGRFFLFESTADVTGYKSGHSPGPYGYLSGHAPVAYIFDAEAPNQREPVTCLSCRPDGDPPVGAVLDTVEPAQVLKDRRESNTYPQSLVERDGQPVVFFRSRDSLAPGAPEGEWSLYEWVHNQVFRIASDLHRGEPGAFDDDTLDFLGASAEGTDVYFVGATALTWEDPDARKAIWDARVEGGFPQPAAPPVCDAASEGACQGPSSSALPSLAPGTIAVGTGNVTSKSKTKKHHKKKHHKKKHHKKSRGKKKSDKGSKARARHARANRGAGK